MAVGLAGKNGCAAVGPLAGARVRPKTRAAPSRAFWVVPCTARRQTAEVLSWGPGRCSKRHVARRPDDGTPLGCASLFGEVACARFLLDHGADPNKMDKTGNVALHSAAKNGNGEIIRLLLSRGARVNIAVPQGTPLHIAASYGNSNAVKILLDHHADPNIISEVSGSPLVSALQSTKLVNESDSLECVKLLIKAGADVNSATPLEVATLNGLTDCIKYLLEAGVDPNTAKNKAEEYGKTAKFKLKLDGDKAVGRKNYLAASKLYTQAIELDPDDATLYSNRSLCHLKIGEGNKALLDANSCIKIRPEWLKGYYRKGAALMSLKEYKEACDAFLAGLKLDPTNVDMERMFWEAIEAMKKDHVTT